VLPLGWARRARQRLFRGSPADGACVTLTHSRIYVLPSRRGLAVIGTLALMLVASLNYGLALGLAVTFLLSGLVAAALLNAFRNLAGLTVRPVIAGEGFAGLRIAFTLALEGGGRDRIAIELAAKGATPAVVDVPGAAAPRVSVEVEAPRRGRIALGRLTVSTTYPLGLWRGWSYVHFPLEGIAWPVPEAAPPALPSGTAVQDESGPAHRGDADLAGLRDYRSGDPMQRVAWKAVARGGVWYTKEFDGTASSGPVPLDYDALPPSLDTEARLSRLTAWVLACERASRPYALALPDLRLTAGLGGEHRREALAALALFPKPPPSSSRQHRRGRA
jgi:uncharacterized protein (DUF58 family)